MHIVIGSDHGGYRLKEVVKEYLLYLTIPFEDMGAHSQESCDYPDIAKLVAEKIISGEYLRGILICGSGIGMSIAANRFPGIRAAVCNDLFSAQMSRKHNDSNILTMGERFIGDGLAMEIISVWLNTPFEGGRHMRRITMIDSMLTRS